MASSDAGLLRPVEQSSDRRLHDDVIRYLADAELRRRASVLPLSSAAAAKADRFARFLARRYYRDRVVRSFRYARLLADRTRCSPDDFIDGADFDAVLAECVLGSFQTAARVAGLLLQHLTGGQSPGQWWGDLLQYESSFFLQMATSERIATSDRPQRSASAVVRRFGWRMPELLPRLRSGERVGDELHSPATLLFSRTQHGRICVAEIGEPIAAVFTAVNGLRTAQEIAAGARLPLSEVTQALRSLAEVGAVV